MSTEVDHFWDSLVAGGAPSRCGWLTDKFGVPWQVVPKVLPALLGGSDKAGAKRAADAMMKMIKLDIGALQRAYEAASGRSMPGRTAPAARPNGEAR